MNESQWTFFMEWMSRIMQLVEEIANNTRPEKVEEPYSRVRGFAGDDLNGNGGDQL